MWPAWWGGSVASTEPPLIAKQMIALRKKIGLLVAAKKQGVPYKVKSADDLMEKLRGALDDLDMVAPVVAQEITHLPHISGENKYGDATTTIVTHVKATVRLGCADGSFVDLVGSGHGTSEDDKAGGKASTYAWKDALLKGESVPGQGMVDTDDESKPLPAQPRVPVIDMWAAAIQKCTSVAACDKLKGDMAKLKVDTQLALTPAWQARRDLLAAQEKGEK